MRKLMVAAMAVAGLGLATGCKSNVERQRENVAEAQRDVAKEQQDMQQKVAEARQDNAQEVAEAQQEGQKDVNDAREDLAEAQGDLAESQYKNADDSATGGSGMAADSAKVQEIKGTIQSASSNALSIIVPSEDNRVVSFKANSGLQVLHDDQPMTLSSLKAGDEVRASYKLGQNGEKMLTKVEVTEASAQHPDMKK
jgi:vacuolar-type H+-ATPase subunit H